jgi:hypothetical protein
MTVPTVETPARFSGSPDHFGDRVIVCVPITLGPRRIRRACFKAPQILLLKFRNDFSVIGFLNCLAITEQRHLVMKCASNRKNWLP